MNDLRDFFRLLRYLLIFLVVVVGMAFFSKAHAADYGCDSTWSAFSTVDYDYLSSAEFDRLNYWKQTKIKLAASYKPPKYVYFRKESAKWEPPKYPNPSNPNLGNIVVYFEFRFCTSEVPEPKPCETPKTDAQCNKGNTAVVTGNQAFWDSGNYQGCTFVSSGVGVIGSDGNKTQDATSTGTTGQAWCSVSDSTYNPVDDAALAANPDYKPALDNKPSNCPNGWIQAGGSKYYCVDNGSVDAPPDKVNPDGSINSDKDGNPQPPDANVGKPPTEGGDGGGGDTGGGGDGSGGGTGDGNGISKGDIKDGVKEGVEEALGKGSGAPAPMIPPSVEGVEGGINGVMSRYKQRINNAPISSAFNNISFSVPSAGCSPWGVHLDYLDVNLQFDQCTFLNSHSSMIGALMMAVFAGLSLVVFLKA